MMPVEIRLNKHGNDFVCDWGTFHNSEANPTRGLQHLMLATGDYVQRLLENGQEPGTHGGIASVTTDNRLVGDRIFAHLDYEGQRTTWELFKAHFWDGKGPDDIYVGRWPD